MERFLDFIKNRYTAGIVALLLASLFLATPAAAGGPEDFRIDFRADRTQIRPGECVTVFWDTANVREVYYNDQGVSGIQQSRLECPASDQTYTLRVVTRDGQEILRHIPVTVAGTWQNWENWENWENWQAWERWTDNLRINFWADRT